MKILLLSLSLLVLAVQSNANHIATGDTLIKGKKNINEQVAYDLYETETAEVNILNSFKYMNQKDAFSITLYAFKGEKVQVMIHDAASGKKLFAINVEPDTDIFEADLITKPLPKGNYYVIVKGESRIIPKEMSIQ